MRLAVFGSLTVLGILHASSEIEAMNPLPGDEAEGLAWPPSTTDDPHTLRLWLSDLRRRLLNANNVIAGQRAALAGATEEV